MTFFLGFGTVGVQEKTYFKKKRFAVFLPQISSIEWITQKLNGVLQRLKRLSKELNIEKSISISIGIYEIQFSDSFREIFIKADKALYQAKKSGKNRYEFYSD